MWNVFHRSHPVGRAGALPALSAGVFLLSGCGGGGGTPATPTPTVAGQIQTPQGLVTFGLSADRGAYSAGQTATLTFTEEADRDAPGDVDEMNHSPDATDFLVSQGGRTVYQYSLVGSASAPGLVGGFLERGDPSTTMFHYALRDQAGNPLPPGRYTVSAWANVTSLGGAAITDPQRRTAARPITIQ